MTEPTKPFAVSWIDLCSSTKGNRVTVYQQLILHTTIKNKQKMTYILTDQNSRVV